MKPERAFIAQRIAAQHCPELLRAGPSRQDLMRMLSQLGERMARTLPRALAPLTGGASLSARAAPAEDCSTESLGGAVAPLAAHSLLAAGPGEVPVLCVIDGAAVLRTVDRAFGGRGEAPSPLPEQFPHSAELLVARLEAAIAECLGTALGAGPRGMVRALRRDTSLAQLVPFPGEAALVRMAIAVTEGSGAAWPLVLALPAARLAELLGHGAPAPARTIQRRTPADPAAAPFADLPLPLRAVLVDMRVPMATIAALQPGQVLPVPVARAVPLCAGETVIAHGSVGAMDDRVALQLTRTF